MKIYALYLPQFHRIPENDEWWGEGFTEWTNVKKAKQYTKKQTQPRVPIDGYYDLADISNIERQVNLAKRYGVDGFCIYNYYSCGRKLLSKPAELLLNNKSIETTFFFSWANHDWRRTWAGYNTEILMKQEYGGYEEIKQHYEYLRDFFKDNRYLKIDNKPVFLLYQNIDKPILEQYKTVFDCLAKQDGFQGVYWVGTLKSKKDHYDVDMEDYFKCEADFSRNSLGIVNLIFRLKNKSSVILNKIHERPFSISYNMITKQIDLYSKRYPNYIQGVCVGWDNTPRHKGRGYYYHNFSVRTFSKHLKNQYYISKQNKKPFLIINAWNEWGEGAYLEPDQLNGYSLLECIKTVKEKENKEDVEV